MVNRVQKKEKGFPIAMLPTKTIGYIKPVISVMEARIILGKAGIVMKEAEIRKIISVLQLLSEVWLDKYERDKFEGKTVQEIYSNI